MLNWLEKNTPTHSTSFFLLNSGLSYCVKSLMQNSAYSMNAELSLKTKQQSYCVICTCLSPGISLGRE